ncbi:MAG: tetratricopeptide repeat protein [Isosphaeraceae bacterium]
MVSARINRCLLLLAALVAGAGSAVASDVIEVPKLKFGIVLNAKPTRNHLRDAVQKTPNFWLMDGNKKIVPSRPGFIYRIERTERGMILLSLPSQGLYGWAPRDAVIPYNEAEGYFTDEIETHQPTSFNHLVRAIVCRDNGRFDNAFRDLDQALRLDPKNVPALIERSFLWQARNRMDLALKDVDRAVQVNPKAADAYLERGVYRYRLKDHQDALADLDHAAELGSRSIYIPLVRGSIFVERRELEDAQRAFEEAIVIDPRSFDAHLMLGSVQLLRSKATAAVSTFARAIKLEPEKGGGYGGRAVAYMSLGRHREALDDLNKAIQFDSMRADLFRDRGQIFAMQSQWNQALADLNTALRIDPGDVEANVALSWILATCDETKLRDGARAVALGTRACELTQWKSARPLATLAAAFAEKGDFKSAAQMQVKAIELTEEKDPIRNYYRACLNRYSSRKPWHRLTPLEELGLRRYRPPARAAAPQDDNVQRTGAQRPN